MRSICRFGVWLGLLCMLAARADVAAWDAHMAAAQSVAMTTYWQVIGDWKMAVRQYKAAVKDAEQLGPHDPRLAVSLDQLGLCYLHPGQRNVGDDQDHLLQRGEACFQRAKTVREQAFGKDDPRLVISECMLGHVATHKDSPEAEEEARRRYRHALEMLKLVPADDTDTTVQAIDLVLQYFREEDATLVPTLERQALGAVERAYGKDDPRIAPRLYQLAAALENDKEAEACYRRAVHNAELAYGKDDPRTGEALVYLATYLLPKQPAAARATRAHVLKNAEQAYGPDDPRLLPTLYLLAEQRVPFIDDNQTAMSTDEMLLPIHYADDAEHLLARAAQVADHAGVPAAQVEAWSRLAAFYRRQGQQEEAWRPLERALAAAEQAYGRDDPRILPALTALIDWSINEDPASLAPLSARVGAVMGRANGNDLALLACVEHLAMPAGNRDDSPAPPPAEITPLLLRYADILEHTPDVDPEDVVPLLWRIANVPQTESSGAELPPAYARVLAYMEKAYGPASPRLADGLTQLMNNPSRSPAVTIALARRLAPLIPKVYPAGSEQLATAYSELGDRFREQDALPDAIAAYQQSLATWEALPQPPSEQRAELLAQLANLYQQQHDLPKAEDFVRKSMALREQAGEGNPEQTSQVLLNFYLTTNQPLKAAALYAEMYDAAVKAHGAESMEAMDIQLNQATQLLAAGKPTEADTLLRHAQPIVEKLAAQNANEGGGMAFLHQRMLVQRILVWQALGNPPETDTSLTRLLAKVSGAGAKNPYWLPGLYYLIRQERHSGQPSEKVAALFSTILAAVEKKPVQNTKPPIAQPRGPDEPDNALLNGLLCQMGETYAALHDTPRADACFARLLAADIRADGADVRGGTGEENATRLTSILAYYRAQGRFDVVEGIWRRYLKGVRKHGVGYSPIAEFDEYIPIGEFDATLQLCDALIAQRKCDEAEKLLQPLLATARDLADAPDDPLPPALGMTLGKLYAAQGKPEQAEPLLRAALTAATPEMPPNAPMRFMTPTLPYFEAYAAFLHAQKRDADAKPLDEKIKALRAEAAQADAEMGYPMGMPMRRRMR